jgi:hypothetical protein
MAMASSEDCAAVSRRALSRGVTIELPVEAVRKANQERRTSLSERSLSSSVSSLIVGRHLVLIAETTHSGLALAETISDVAAETGLCYGSLILGPDAARLLSLEDVIAYELRYDFWLIAQATDPAAINRVDTYIAEAPPAGSWRAIIVTDVGYGEALRGLASDSRQRFAFVDVS